MELRAPLLSSAVCVVGPVPPTVEVNFLPKVARAIQEEFSFVGAPSTVDDYKIANGLKFNYGFIEAGLIDSMTVYDDGIFCQAVLTTDRIAEAILRTIDLLRSKFGLVIAESNFRWHYASKVEVTMKAGFAEWLDQFQPFASLVRATLESKGMAVTEYQPIGFILGGESEGVVKPGKFVLERRAEIPFTENVFYSEAPLSTEEHLNVLEQIEASF